MGLGFEIKFNGGRSNRLTSHASMPSYQVFKVVSWNECYWWLLMYCTPVILERVTDQRLMVVAQTGWPPMHPCHLTKFLNSYLEWKLLKITDVLYLNNTEEGHGPTFNVGQSNRQASHKFMASYQACNQEGDVVHYSVVISKAAYQALSADLNLFRFHPNTCPWFNTITNHSIVTGLGFEYYPCIHTILPC